MRPGRLAYRWDDSARCQSLLDQLAQHGWWGQIVGPHGTGKSTLLHALVPHFSSAGRHVLWLTLTAGQRQLPASPDRLLAGRDTTTLLIIDGYEQLSRFARWRLRRRCRRHGVGLLVTTHRTAAAFPVTIAVRCRLETVQQIVADLLHGYPDVLSPDDVSRCYHQSAGNVRETLFALYDLYEQRRPET